MLKWGAGGAVIGVVGGFITGAMLGSGLPMGGNVAMGIVGAAVGGIVGLGVGGWIGAIVSAPNE